MKNIKLSRLLFVVGLFVMAPLWAMEKEDQKIAAAELNVPHSKMQELNSKMLQLGKKLTQSVAENKKLKEINHKLTTEQNALKSESGYVQIPEQLLNNTLQAVTYSNQEIAQLSGEKVHLVIERDRLIKELDYQQKILALENQILLKALEEKEKTLSFVSQCVPFATGDTPITQVKMTLSESYTLRKEDSYSSLLKQWQRFGICVESGKDIPVLYVKSMNFVDKKKDNDSLASWTNVPPFFVEEVIIAQQKLGLLDRCKTLIEIDKFKFPTWIPAESVDGKNKIMLSVLGVPFECEIIYANFVKKSSYVVIPSKVRLGIALLIVLALGYLHYESGEMPYFLSSIIK